MLNYNSEIKNIEETHDQKVRRITALEKEVDAIRGQIDCLRNKILTGKLSREEIKIALCEINHLNEKMVNVTKKAFDESSSDNSDESSKPDELPRKIGKLRYHF